MSSCSDFRVDLFEECGKKTLHYRIINFPSLGKTVSASFFTRNDLVTPVYLTNHIKCIIHKTLSNR